MTMTKRYWKARPLRELRFYIVFYASPMHLPRLTGNIVFQFPKPGNSVYEMHNPSFLLLHR